MTTVYKLTKASLDPVFLLLILIAIGFLFSFQNRKRWQGRIVLLLAFFALYMASIFQVSNALCYILEKEYLLKNRGSIDRLDIVVVLGGGASYNKYLGETMPSHLTASRLLYAVQIFRKSKAKYLICVGKGFEKLSEAEVMGIAAERLGVPVTQVKLDTRSMNTRGHAEELNKMFDDKNLKIGLVTSAYHMERSEREFKKYFHNVIPLPSDYLYSSRPLSIITIWPRTTHLYTSFIAMHEIIGIAWYKMRN